MAHYVDGFVLPVPKKTHRTYRKISQRAGKIWREYGALEYRECAGDDLNIKGVASFPRQFKVKPGETVIFSWIRVQVARASRSRQQESDERSAAGQHDGPEGDAVRPQADVYGRFHEHRLALIRGRSPLPASDGSGLRLVSSRRRPRRNGEPVPSVDGDHRKRERDDLSLLEVARTADTSSGTCVSPTRVTDSVHSSAARSRSLKKGASRHALSA